MPVLDEEERAIDDSARKVLSAMVEKAVPEADSAAHWNELVGQGWLLMLVPEDSGGLGLPLRYGVVVARQLGMNGCSLPVVPAMAAARALAMMAPGHKLTGRVLEEGALVPALLMQGHMPLFGPTVPRPEGYLVLDRDDGLILWEETTPVAKDDCLQLLDGSLAACLVPPAHPDAIHQMCGAGGLKCTLAILTAAELLGIADAVFQKTVEYLKTRQQFGRPIAKFQALQHRLADMFVKLQALEALVFEAARAELGPRSAFAARAAIHRARETTIDLCQEAVQLHGAMGYSDECEIGARLKRAMVIDSIVARSLSEA